MAKILIIDDDERLLETLSDALILDAHQTESVKDGREGLSRLKQYQYDVVIVDWNLPDITGPQICQRFRQAGGMTPVLMLTGNDKISDRTEGLDSGADDYLIKPFAMDELRARIRALIRRSTSSTSNLIGAGTVQIDLKKRRAYISGQEIQLLAKEFALLEYFLLHKGEVLSVEALLERVWGYDSEATGDACRQCIARLRKKIDQPNTNSIIRTIIGIGYTID
jgi:two-component system response regulator MprA